MRYRTSPITAAVGIVLGLATLVLIGSAVPSISSAGALLLTGLFVLLATVTAMGNALGEARAHSSLALPVTETIRADERRFRIARYGYYAGLATSGLLVLRPALGFTLSDFIFFVALGAALLERSVDHRATASRLPRSVIVGVVLFVLSAGASTIPLAHAGSSLGVIARFVYLTIPWLWMGGAVLFTANHIRRAAAAWIFGAALSTSGALVLALGHVIPGSTERVGRFTGFTDQFNQLGGMCAMALMPCIVLAVGNRRLTVRAALAWAAVALLAIGVGLSGSVGSILGASAGVLYLMVGLADARRVRRLVAGLFLTIMVGCAGFLFLGSATPGARLQGILGGGPGHSAGSINSRVETYLAAWSSVLNHPLLGVGLTTNTQVAATGHKVHNILLLPWYTAGFFAMLGLAIMLLSIFAIGWRLTTDVSRPSHALNVGLAAAYLTAVVYAMGEPVLYQRFFWIPIALVISARTAADRTGATVRASRSFTEQDTPSAVPQSVTL